MSKNIKYKTTYIDRGAMIVKGPCKHKDNFGGLPSESVVVVDPLGNRYKVGEKLHVLKSEFIEVIPSRKKKPSDTKCYKWMVDNGWKQKSNWKDIQKAFQWVFNNQKTCEFDDWYGNPISVFLFYMTPDRNVWYSTLS